MRERTIASHFVRAALHGAQARDLDIAALLADAGLLPAVLEETAARVTAAQYARLIRLLWRRLDDEYLGLAAQPSLPGTFAMMACSIIHCGTLEKALRRGIRFYRLFPGSPEFSLRREGAQAWLCLHVDPTHDPEHFLSESLLLIWHRLASWLIGQRIELEELRFAYPQPAHVVEYDLLFPGVRHFSADFTGLRFVAAHLDQPLLQDERTLKRFLEQAPADLLSRPAGDDSLIVRIQRLLGRDCRQWPDLEQLARQLNCSPQTLRRRLREQGSSFQVIKDQLRRDRAIYLLGRPELSIQEIAEQLGFSEASAFHRAFRKWTHLTPGAYREPVEK